MTPNGAQRTGRVGAGRVGAGRVGRLMAAIAPVAAIVVVGVALRVACLGDRQLFRDEATSWYLASHPLDGLIGIATRETYPPLYPILLKAWMALFGTAEAALRSLSVVAGIGTAILTWRWARDALGTGVAFVAGFLVAASPALVLVDRQARMYSFETLFTTCAWWLIWLLVADEGMRRGRRRTAIAIGLTLAVAGEVWTMSLGIPSAGLQFTFALIALIWLRTRAAAVAAGCVAVGAVTIAPWLPYLLGVATNGEKFWTPRPDGWALLYTPSSWAVGSLSGAWWIAAVLVALTAVVGLAALARNMGSPPAANAASGSPIRRGRLLALALTLGLSLVPGIWIYSQVRSIYDTRYFGSAVPHFAIAIGAAAVLAARWLRPRVAPAARMPAGALPVLAALPIACLMTVAGGINVASSLDEYGLDPSRQVVQELASKVRPGDVVLALNAQTYFPLTYYLDARGEAERLGIELYEFHLPTAAFFTGWRDIDTDRVIEPAAVAQLGWKGCLHLPAGGTVWLVALDNHDRYFSSFSAYEAGTLRETWSIVIHGFGKEGEIRSAVPIEP
jgi:4-amino-4-deoxy-L-arabinose transferase-like glycosyltransferase